MQAPKDYFVEKAKTYETEPARVNNVQNIGDAILEKLTYDKSKTHIMDFGSGTGLLTGHIAPHVYKITTVDVSPSMNEQLRAKKETLGCALQIYELDLSTSLLEERFDGIISSMTMHHVEDILAMFQKFHAMLHVGGTIALADLDKEDGTFHKEDTGVFHFGFELETFANLVKEAGFKEVNIEIVSVAKKPYGEYPIFLLTGVKS